MDLSNMTISTVNAKLLEDNIMYLKGEINQDTGEEVFTFITQANFMPLNEQPAKLVLFINSLGGCMDSTMSMVGAIRASKIPIYTIATGVCMSGGVMLAMSGHVRLVDEYCNIMSHTLSAGGPADAKHADLKIWVKDVKAHAKKMVTHYQEHTGLDAQKIKKELLPKNGEVYLTAQEAINYHIFDDFFTSYDQIK